MNYAALKTAKQRAWEAVRKIDGWLSEREAGALFELAAESNGPIIEIGSWQGRSTAALALGSMWGNCQRVYAVDSFVGVPPENRLTDHGHEAGWNSSTPDQLRANLDAAGVNGLVTIIPKPSQEAAGELPECGVLFIDGSHEYDAIKRDLASYLPKVRERGRVLIHDCADSDPEVVKAVDETLMTQPLSWAPQKLIDSAMLFERRQRQQHKVMLALPGPNWKYCAVQGILQASQGVHTVHAKNSGNGFDDMNILWVQALNLARRGECTHIAMLHADVSPIPFWLDKLLAECDDCQADLVSAVWRLKEPTGCTSSGIGDWDNQWGAFRRFTSKELLEMPATFSIADTEYPDKFLLHNTGCWVADLRKPLWRETDERGYLRATFSFPIAAAVQPDGEIIHLRESEDWYFSRRVAELGARTFITRKVYGAHVGDYPFHTNEPGCWEHGDEGTAENWRPVSPQDFDERGYLRIETSN